MENVPVALFGDTGMIGKELEGILKNHDKVHIAYRQNSKREEGNLDVCELVFLATKDPESMQLAPKLILSEKRVIDMSGAFRLDKAEFEIWYGMKHACPELIREAVYGNPSLFRDQIARASLVANPGCYATAVILAMHPLVDVIEGPISIWATSGISGARKEVEERSNERTYRAGRVHQHIPEMERYSGVNIRSFTPTVLESVFRGINANIEARLIGDLAALKPEDAKAAIKERIQKAYSHFDLVYVVEDTKEKSWGTKEINNTHSCIIKVEVCNGYAYVCSMLDNLGKGAASQAVENMNLMLGFPGLYKIHPAYSVASPQQK